MADRREYMKYTPYCPQTNGLEPKQRAQSEYIPYNLQFQKLNSLPSEKVAIDEADYATYLPLWAEISSPSSSEIERTPVADDFTPYTAEFMQQLPSPPASPPTPPTARPPLPPKSSRRQSSLSNSNSHVHSTSASFLPRFRPVPQPKSSPQQQQNGPSSSSYSNFFCRECDCPLADRYGLHDLDDTNEEKPEYKICSLNAQTKEWARSLEMLRQEENKAKISMGKERKHPRNLPKIDTGVANYYRAGMQQRF